VVITRIIVLIIVIHLLIVVVIVTLRVLVLLFIFRLNMVFLLGDFPRMVKFIEVKSAQQVLQICLALLLQMLLEFLDLNKELIVYVPQLLKRIGRNVALVVLFSDGLPELVRVSDVVQALAFLKGLPLQIFLFHNNKHKSLIEQLLHQAIQITFGVTQECTVENIFNEVLLDFDKLVQIRRFMHLLLEFGPR